MLESNTLYVNDENGNEMELEILFTFENDEIGKKYVVFADPQDESGEVYASAYDEAGNLLPIETDAEWSMVEEVLGAFSQDEDSDSE
ncbi:MAG: DUF1292 domain-containing protein [Erysipelotrichaceae bacterium]|nr:DUF1292 domain-containing protein [Erysipelotrichaceae bacterium]